MTDEQYYKLRRAMRKSLLMLNILIIAASFFGLVSAVFLLINLSAGDVSGGLFGGFWVFCASSIVSNGTRIKSRLTNDIKKLQSNYKARCTR